MSYKLDVLKDNPVGLWLFDETSGTVAYDSSQYENNATYNGTFDSDFLPIIANGVNSKLITHENNISYSVTKDYLSNSNLTSFGVKENSDNDFSIELWIRPYIETYPSSIPLFGDYFSQVGIFWSYGNIVFQLKDKSISYAIPNIEKAFYIVGIYSVNSMSLYVNGELVESLYFDDMQFTNTSIDFTTGPCTNSKDSFLIDSVSVYRYSLNSNQIANHYFSAQSIPAIQIVNPDDGQLFQISDTGISRQFEYVYPANKSWRYFNNDYLLYNNYEESLSLISNGSNAAGYTTIEDVIIVPLGFDLNSSKIEWNATKGVEIYASIDNVSFFKCENGFSIPRYKYGYVDFDASRKVYLSIRFSSPNQSKFLPKIYNLMLSFYNNKHIYPINGGAVISHLSDSNYMSDITFGNYLSPVLFRDLKNGLMCNAGSGFNLQTKKSIKTIEFFYTPNTTSILDPAIITDIAASNILIIDADLSNISQSEALLDSMVETLYVEKGNLLFNIDSETDYSWDVDGIIEKNNIVGIYINGINKINETSIQNVFKDNRLHHVVIVFDTPLKNDIKFNYSLQGTTAATYQNIAIYEKAFSEEKTLDHLNMWTGRYVVSASDSSMTMTENSANAYSNEWVLV